MPNHTGPLTQHIACIQMMD